MTSSTKTVITVENIIQAPVAKVWEYWTGPEHITQWCSASDEWHAPSATNDIKEGGRFSTRMEAKDGSFGFDFGGVYNDVKQHEFIAYTMDDGRRVEVIFSVDGDSTKVVESFEAETENPEEMQRGGWHAILNNFKKYTESN
jgi:uncharacterized protein YndB with AHSA1/START domain